MTIRELADDPISYDKDGYDNPVADALDPRLAALNARAAAALKAGAMGFSSSRASTHVTPEDKPVASRIAEWEEIDSIVAAMAGSGISDNQPLGTHSAIAISTAEIRLASGVLAPAA